MAKILFVLALLVAVAFAQTLFGVCRPQICVNEGAACDLNVFTNISATYKERRCKGGDFCKSANTSDTTIIAGTCAELAEVGEACTSASDCEGDLSCVNKFCNRGFLPGANCKVPNDCLYFAENGDASVSCNNGKCAGIAAGAKCSRTTQSCLPPNVCGTDGTCVAPVGAGATCRSDYHCQRAFFCNGTCTARIVTGQACSLSVASDQQCVDKSMCVPNGQTGDDATKGTCKEMYTGVAGSLCDDDDETCGENLACLAAGQGSSNQYGACGPSVASSRRACNASTGADNTNVCSANEFCVCNQNTGSGACYSNTIQVVKKGAKGRLNSYKDCFAKCSRTDWNCLAKCEGKFCNYDNNILKTNDNAQSNLQLCAFDRDSKYQEIPGYIECSSGSFVQFSLVGLVAIIAAILL